MPLAQHKSLLFYFCRPVVSPPTAATGSLEKVNHYSIQLIIAYLEAIKGVNLTSSHHKKKELQESMTKPPEASPRLGGEWGLSVCPGCTQPAFRPLPAPSCWLTGDA